MSKQDYRVGDIFRFKIDEDCHGYGQIVAAKPRSLKYFAIFDVATSKQIDLDQIASSKVLILAPSMDAKLENGDWRIVGNAPVAIPFVFPEYKVHTSDGWMVASHDGEILRAATRDDLHRLKTQKSFSPAALEYAIKAHLGLVQYLAFCEGLIVDSRR